MTIPASYIGHKDFLDMKIAKEFYPLTTKENSEKWVQEDILTNYGTDYRVHLVRVNVKNVDVVQNACIRKGINSEITLQLTAYLKTKLFFKEPLTQHIVLGVKGFFVGQILFQIAGNFVLVRHTNSIRKKLIITSKFRV